MNRTIIFPMIVCITLIVGISGIAHAQTASTPFLTGYFVEVNGKQTGPFDMTVLAQMAMTGMILAGSLVWKEGMSSWLKADSIDELKSVFMNPPTNNTTE